VRLRIPPAAGGNHGKAASHNAAPDMGLGCIHTHRPGLSLGKKDLAVLPQPLHSSGILAGEAVDRIGEGEGRIGLVLQPVCRRHSYNQVALRGSAALPSSYTAASPDHLL
jgi:hypothetical protein